MSQPINGDDRSTASALRAISKTTHRDFLSLSSLKRAKGRRGSLTAHVQRNKSVVPTHPTAKTPPPPPPYQCQQCPASFNGLFQFYGHTSVHSKKRMSRKLRAQDLTLAPPNANGLQGIDLNKHGLQGIDLNNLPPPTP